MSCAGDKSRAGSCHPSAAESEISLQDFWLRFFAFVTYNFVSESNKSNYRLTHTVDTVNQSDSERTQWALKDKTHQTHQSDIQPLYFRASEVHCNVMVAVNAVILFRWIDYIDWDIFCCCFGLKGKKTPFSPKQKVLTHSGDLFFNSL